MTLDRAVETFMSMFAATTLIIEISCRASFLPTVSIFHAA